MIDQKSTGHWKKRRRKKYNSTRTRAVLYTIYTKRDSRERER